MGVIISTNFRVCVPSCFDSFSKSVSDNILLLRVIFIVHSSDHSSAIILYVVLFIILIVKFHEIIAHHGFIDEGFRTECFVQHLGIEHTIPFLVCFIPLPFLENLVLQVFLCTLMLGVAGGLKYSAGFCWRIKISINFGFHVPSSFSEWLYGVFDVGHVFVHVIIFISIVQFSRNKHLPPSVGVHRQIVLQWMPRNGLIGQVYYFVWLVLLTGILLISILILIIVVVVVRHHIAQITVAVVRIARNVEIELLLSWVLGVIAISIRGVGDFSFSVSVSFSYWSGSRLRIAVLQHTLILLQTADLIHQLFFEVSLQIIGHFLYMIHYLF